MLGWVGTGGGRVADKPAQPPTLVCKMEAQSEYVNIAYMFFARLGADSYAHSVLTDKISASELRRKFV